MPNNKAPSVTIILVIAIVSVTIFIFARTMQDENTVDRDSSPKTNTVAPTVPVQTNENTNSSTIANEWQWQDTVDEKEQGNVNIETDQDESLPFTPQSVHDALQAVKLDANGDVILDHEALISLDEALERIYNQLDNDSLVKLRNLIEDALPGKTGEQTANLVEDYNGFLRAKEEFSQIHEGSNTNTTQTIASLENDQALYSELQALRELHLGQSTAQSLFQTSDANAEFMFESMKLGLDNSLSAEEVANRRDEIEERHRQRLDDSTN